MVNSDNPNGFAPYTSGGVGNPRMEYMPLSATNTAFEVGDPLTIAAGDVNKAAASNALCGVAAESKAANAGGSVAVYNDPEQRFTAQTDDGTGTLTAVGNVGKNADFVAGAGSNGHSTAEIDENSGANTATLPLKVLGLEPSVKNAFGEFNRLIVKINNHQLDTGTGTVGS